MNKNKVEVVDYNEEWPRMFEMEAGYIREALGDNCLEVHPIGSTAVRGLRAKAIIDIMPVVRDIMRVDAANGAMAALGYVAKGENGMLFRRYFEKGGPVRTHNVHVYEEGNSEIERHLKFRDWMRSHPEDRERYGRLKAELAAKYPNDLLSYIVGKEEFVTAIDRNAGYNGLRVVKALTPREWEAVERLRQEYLGSNNFNFSDSCKDNVYFVLYQGVEIIGYAQIGTRIDDSLVVEVIFISKDYYNRDIEAKFAAMCERWVGQKI